MSLYPSAPDVFVDRTGAHSISSSDPNNAYDGIEAIQNFIGAAGEAQSKLATLTNLFRPVFRPLPVMSYVDTVTVSIEASEIALFNTNDFVIKRNTVATTCSVANDLLVGTVDTTSWYNVYVIGDGANTNYTLGLLGQGTDPAVYATYYKCVNAVLTDSNSQIYEFYQCGRTMIFDDYVLKRIIDDDSSDTVWEDTSVDAANKEASTYIPAISRLGIFVTNPGSDIVHLRPNGSGNADGVVQSAGGVHREYTCPVDEAQILEWKTVGASGNNIVYCKGYVITEI